MLRWNGISITSTRGEESSPDIGSYVDGYHAVPTPREEVGMTGEIDNQLLDLKEFTFDGDTGRTLRDLYESVNAIGGTKDSPFVRPFQLEGHERPGVVNAYLDAEGRRFHIVWYSDKSGLSQVDDVILGAPSLAKDRQTDACQSCGEGIYGILAELEKER